jgi:hypothetical protein
MNQLLSHPAVAAEEPKDTQAEDALNEGQGQISGYVPKMGLFE